MPPKSVKVEWIWLHWNRGYVWREDIVPQLKKHNITEKDLRKCVYVIAANGLFAIDYPKKVSPTLYIGSGNFKARLAQHESWLNEITALVYDYSFSVAVCIPTCASVPVHKEMEATLIQEFKHIYGCLPIRNQKSENPMKHYNYSPPSEFRKPLMIGRGHRYHWAIRPLKSNRYYKSYFDRM